MTNKMVDFQKSQAMPDRPGLETVVALVLALLPIIAVAILVVSGFGRTQSPALVNETEDAFDYEAAASFSALRWRAMAAFYEGHGLLTRSTADQVNIAPSWDVVQAERLEAERQMALLRRYTTAPGWEQALTDEQAAAAQPAEDYAYYTERYWKHAAESSLNAREADWLDLRHHRR